MIEGQMQCYTRYLARLECLEPEERIECYRDRLGWWYLDGGGWTSRSFKPLELYPIPGVDYSNRAECAAPVPG